MSDLPAIPPAGSAIRLGRRDRALSTVREMVGRTVGALESWVELCHIEGTRLVDVLDRAVDLYERQVVVQEHLAFGSDEDEHDEHA